MSRKAKPHTGIYAIVNKVNGRMYIGSAMRFNKRWKEHIRGLESGKHHSRFLSRCWAKHGADNFEFKILLYCSPENLLMYEQAFLDFYKPIYNTAKIAGSQLGYRHTEEARKKMSQSRAKNFSPMTGRSHTEETRKKISDKKTGVKQSDEAVAKRSAAIKALKGRHSAKKFTEHQIRDIRTRLESGETSANLARFYCVSSSVICEIKKHRAYRWVE